MSHKKIKKRKKIKRKIELVIVIIIVAAITAIAFWSAWFGNSHPQTGLQYAETLAGRGKLGTDATDAVVFLGDSITAREDWNVLLGVSNITNAGISGNTTDDILARLEPIISGRPKKIFLMIGINDLLRGKDVPYVLANYGIILNRIKSESPNTAVYVESVLPINNDISQAGTVDSQKIIALNGQLKSLAEKNGYLFIDLYPRFCGSDNKLYQKYASDGLHPDAAGYAIWKILISQYLD